MPQLHTAKAALANSPWPMGRNNQRQNNISSYNNTPTDSSTTYRMDLVDYAPGPLKNDRNLIYGSGISIDSNDWIYLVNVYTLTTGNQVASLLVFDNLMNFKWKKDFAQTPAPTPNSGVALNPIISTNAVFVGALNVVAKIDMAAPNNITPVYSLSTNSYFNSRGFNLDSSDNLYFNIVNGATGLDELTSVASSGGTARWRKSNIYGDVAIDNNNNIIALSRDNTQVYSFKNDDAGTPNWTKNLDWSGISIVTPPNRASLSPNSNYILVSGEGGSNVIKNDVTTAPVKINSQALTFTKDSSSVYLINDRSGHITGGPWLKRIDLYNIATGNLTTTSCDFQINNTEFSEHVRIYEAVVSDNGNLYLSTGQDSIYGFSDITGTCAVKTYIPPTVGDCDTDPVAGPMCSDMRNTVSMNSQGNVYFLTNASPADNDKSVIFQIGPNPGSIPATAPPQMVTVKVEWKEGSRDEKVELKTILRDVR